MLQTLRGARALHVRAVLPRAGVDTTVFLVHGAGGRADQWRLVTPALEAAGLGVVSYDALGHGDSPAPRRWREYAGSQWVADLRALVKAHGSARNVLVGHSYGTGVVLGALAQGLDGIERALLLAPPAPEAYLQRLWISHLPVALLERLRPKLSAGFRAAAWGPDALSALVDEETEISDRNSLYVFKAMWRQRLRLDLAALRSLTLQVQVLAGKFDRLTPPAGAARLARSLRHCDLSVLPRCGHQIPLEQPQAVIDAVLAQGAQ